MAAQITINEERCKGCGVCVEACPRGLIVLRSEINLQGYNPAFFVNTDGQCKGCKICAEMCPDMCIEVYK
ncbi:MAG: 4Fe-4S binding protein [bacterium]